MWLDAVDYILLYLPRDNGQWRAVGNTATNHRVAYRPGNFITNYDYLHRLRAGPEDYASALPHRFKKN
jgi:hypothetical protein